MTLHDVSENLGHLKAAAGGALVWLLGQVVAVVHGIAPPWSVVPPLLFGAAALVSAVTNYRKNEQALRLERERHAAELRRITGPIISQAAPAPLEAKSP